MARWKATGEISVRELFPSLLCVTTSWQVDGAEKRLHSYYLPELAVLVDGPDRVAFYKDHAATFADAGIKYHLLTHGADASAACSYVEKNYGAAPYIHDGDAEYASRKARTRIVGTFSDEHEVLPGLEAIPLPGHTAGFTVYRWASPSGTYVFCGDIVYRDRRGWTAFLNDGLHQVGANSLARLATIDCDALLPNETWSDPAPPVPFEGDHRNEIVSQALARVRSKYKVTPE